MTKYVDRVTVREIKMYFEVSEVSAKLSQITHPSFCFNYYMNTADVILILHIMRNIYVNFVLDKRSPRISFY